MIWMTTSYDNSIDVSPIGVIFEKKISLKIVIYIYIYGINGNSYFELLES